MFDKKKILVSFSFILITCAVWYAYNFFTVAHQQYNIRDMRYPADAASIDALFHKGDNWYWMICSGHQDSYSIDHMLRHKSSSQYAKKYDLIAKVCEIDNKIAGFTAYYPKSEHVWQFLFLIVDQDFRRKGVARALLQYAVEDMVQRGALKIDTVTRRLDVENTKALNLYVKFGFKKVGHNSEQWILTWLPEYGMFRSEQSAV